jgi:hypothetical protein
MALSRHPGSSSGPIPFTSGNRPEPRRSLRSPHPSMVSPTAVHFELGPCSLDPAAVFAARMPSLFETRRRLTTSATCLRRAGNQTKRLSLSSQGRRPRPPSFSYAPRLLPCESGDARRAARRSLRRPRCWFLPLARVYPAAIPPRAPRHRRLPGRCVARINVHGSKDRVKDASRSACDDVSCLRSVPTLEVA